MGFTDSAEVVKYIGGIFETAFDDPDIGPKLVDTGLVVAFEFTEPDSIVVVDMAARAVRDRIDGGQPPTATMFMTADIGSAYWQGKVNLPLAMAKKKIRVQGNVASLLKLAPMGKTIFPKYVQRLKDDGREDLLA
jgi:putative sterol carrier protein